MTSLNSRGSNRYQVAILGTGIGGTILAAILAKHGIRVLLLEQGVHPRFAIGESTVPETTMLLRLLSVRYGVPEIGHLSTHQSVSRHVTSSCGVKRNFSFLYHRRGEPLRPEESTQYPTFAPPLGPDVHLFRQDVDAFMLMTAVSYGATVHQRTQTTDVSFHDGGVVLHTSDGATFEADYVVDAGGIQSLLAKKLGLREAPCRLRTRSRTLYTHMMGVAPADTLCDRAAHGLPSPLSQSTLHHLFQGGWMWVIPFNNHPRSTNPLVSVGLTLDIDRHPRPDLPPEQEFRQFIGEYPSIARQFERAVAIREWTATDRLQFSSERAVGDRFCLLPHAASFVDPLFSSGLGVTMACINILADRLIKAASDGDYSAARFNSIDVWMKRNFDYYDRLVSGSYASFHSFPLWNAWTRLWMIGGLYGAVGAVEMFWRYEQAKDPSALTLCEQFPYRGVQGSELPEFIEVFDTAERELDAFRSGSQTDEEAARRIFALVDGSGLWPGPWGRARPERRHTGTFTLAEILPTMVWIRLRGRENVRKHYCQNFLPRFGSLSLFTNDFSAELRHSGRGLATLARDSFVSWNRDWTSP
ncbi:NAD(P)/FAD-dependent oxidoreductase [Sorangium sp. So ce136]|uniref:NAD(P)/FAD-dependent oxidoreductase n=1 Tax=Sorangium sp. So ce136 TaxID=3133284 RepID=UPI003F0C6CF7